MRRHGPHSGAADAVSIGMSQSAIASSRASIFRGDGARFDPRFPRGLHDGAFEFGSDLEALGAVDAIAQFSLKHFDQFVNARHRRDLSCEGIGEEPASPRETGVSRRQLAGFQMMTFLVGSSPGAGATLP